MIFANLFTFLALIYLVSSNLQAIAPIIRAAPILGLPIWNSTIIFQFYDTLTSVNITN